MGDALKAPPAAWASASFPSSLSLFLTSLEAADLTRARLPPRLPLVAAGTSPRFLIDGFPRKMDQAHKFDDSVCASKAVLFFSCTEEVMLERLMERGKTSGREDDNKESIIKRFSEYPVVFCSVWGRVVSGA